MNKNFKRGMIEGSTIVIILLSVALIGMGAFGIWAYINYTEARTDVDGQKDVAALQAKKEQAEEDEKKFAERVKEPNYVFHAPADLGGVQFNYPKTWSSYVDMDNSDGKGYYAYFHPSVVPPVPKNKVVQQRFALRMSITQGAVADALKPFEKAIKKGELATEAATVNGREATKVEGLFPNDENKNDRIRGIAYYFKVNDKVLMIRTDAATFKKDFDDIVSKTIKFN